MSYEPLQLSDRDLKVSFAVNAVKLEGALRLPEEEARGVVVFARDRGSNHHSLRNQYVARILQRHGLATFSIDLLTPEESTRDLQNEADESNVRLQAARLVGATDWLLDNPTTRSLPIGYFGASTGSGVAFAAAAERDRVVSAIVSRGGHPELAEAVLVRVSAPTLLIVGGRDRPTLETNQSALKQLPSARLAVVPGATHFFDEPCALDTVAQLAGEWFQSYLFPSDFRLPASGLHAKVDWT